MSQRQASPGVQQAKNFSHYIQGIACGAPPVFRVEGISGSRADNGALFIVGEQTPKRANASRVRFGGNDNDDVNGCGA